MGCDCHCHVEVKVKGEWVHYNQPHIDRDYHLFGKLAGVRDEDQEPICEPRGIPNDISTITKLELASDGPDAHTPTWLTAKEAAEVQRWYEKLRGFKFPILFGYVLGNSLDAHLVDEGCKAELNKLGIEDVRVVLWFDN